MSTGDDILAFIASYWKDKGYAPSVRDIAEGVGLASTSTVAWWLMRLQRDGKIEQEVRTPRTIRIVP